MKNVNKLAVLLSLTALLSPALKAKSTEEVYLETCRKDAGVPVPVVVVSPHVPAGFGGQTVPFAFVVDTSGKTSAFVAPSSTDSALVDAVVDALKQWQFKPAVSNGVPVATKVVLPVRIVDDTVLGSRYAAN
jgi:TonB family protein